METESYVIRSGDTLYGIALRMTGDGDRWPELWRRNSRRLRSHDPDLIYPDEVIEIPIAMGHQA